MFSSKSFIVLGLTFRPLISFEFVFVYGVRDQLHSFACGYPVFPATFVENTVLSPLNGLDTFVKNHSTIYTKVYFWALYSIPLVYMSVFMPVPHCFGDYSFVGYFEIRKYESSRFVLLFQDCFG